jgi:hypothetical protein
MTLKPGHESSYRRDCNNCESHLDPSRHKNYNPIAVYISPNLLTIPSTCLSICLWSEKIDRNDNGDLQPATFMRPTALQQAVRIRLLLDTALARLPPLAYSTTTGRGA